MRFWWCPECSQTVTGDVVCPDCGLDPPENRDVKCPKCGEKYAAFFTRCPAYLPDGGGCYEPNPEA